MSVIRLNVEKAVRFYKKWRWGDFDQAGVINKLNTYLKLKNRNITLQGGYCHGLTLLWLYKISIDEEQLFYKVIKKLMACKRDCEFDAIENDIEYFISFIEWLQNSDKYIRHINQFDFESLIELSSEASISFLFHHSQLDTQLPLLIQENKMIFLAADDHSIGIYKKNNNIYLFNTKYWQLAHKKINHFLMLKFEIVKSLFRLDYLPEFKLPLHIFVLSHCQASKPDSSNMSSKIFKKLLASCENINAAGFNGITNLYLACESGNTQAVKQLLKHNANPNHVSDKGWSPLHIAADKGYTDIANLLIKFGALTSITSHNTQPIMLAEARGYKNLAKLLG